MTQSSILKIISLSVQRKHLWKSQMKILGVHSNLKQSDKFRWQISGMNKYFSFTVLKIMLLSKVQGFP